MLPSSRSSQSFPVSDTAKIKLQMLNWANRFNICCFLDNHGYNFSHNSVECLLGAGVVSKIQATAGDALFQLQPLLEKNDWVFGHLGYDLKNEIHGGTSNHADLVGFPDLFFF